jgi:hypothetical protein
LRCAGSQAGISFLGDSCDVRKTREELTAIMDAAFEIHPIKELGVLITPLQALKHVGSRTFTGKLVLSIGS